VGYGGAGFGGSDFLFRVEVIDEEADLLVDADEGGFPVTEEFGDGLGIMDIDALLEAMPGEGAVHGAGVDIDEAEGGGDAFGGGAFAAGAGAVDGDDYWGWGGGGGEEYGGVAGVRKGGGFGESGVDGTGHRAG